MAAEEWKLEYHNFPRKNGPILGGNWLLSSASVAAEVRGMFKLKTVSISSTLIFSLKQVDMTLSHPLREEEV